MTANSEAWIANLIKARGGRVSFHQFMDWALNEPNYGSYACGKIRIGKEGDFATSSSIGNEFAELLSKQILEWIEEIRKLNSKSSKISIVEIGPGEGHFTLGLVNALEKIITNDYSALEIILVEKNKGMIDKQKKLLEGKSNIRIKWSSIKELKNKPVQGIIIANEVLDALPVERIVLRRGVLSRQGVALDSHNSIKNLRLTELPMNTELSKSLELAKNALDINIPPHGAEEGWNTEWHINLDEWFKDISMIITNGTLLVIDYVLEANRYYSKRRYNGTLMKYKDNVAGGNLLEDSGECDLTSHLCLETVKMNAQNNNLYFIGEVKQGLALLSLGLADRLTKLSDLPLKDIKSAFNTREELLRLVDPYSLGDFRWIAFEKMELNDSNEIPNLSYKFLKEPS